LIKIKNNISRLALLIIAAGYCLIESRGEGDLLIFFAAAGDLSNHIDVFKKSYGDGYHYYYSVLFAIFLKPFFTLSYFWDKFFWLVLNLFLFYKIFKLLADSAPLKALTNKQKDLFLFLVFIFSLRFLHENLHASQVTIVILWCCIFGIYYIQQGKVITGSAILALGINLKLLPIVLLPYLIYRGYFKALLFTMLFYAAGLLLPSLIIGHDYNIALLKSWLELINPANQQHILDVDERSFHSLSTLLATLLVKSVPDVYALPIKRNIADISLPALSGVLLFSRLALVSFTLFFLKGRIFAPPSAKWKQYLELSYILLLIPLIFPHQQHYAFLFIAPAFAVVLYYLFIEFDSIPKLERWWLVTALVLIYLSGNLKILVGEFNRYYEHFKILTYGALLLIPLLVRIAVKSRDGLRVSEK
jgi:hypothetical protein